MYRFIVNKKNHLPACVCSFYHKRCFGGVLINIDLLFAVKCQTWEHFCILRTSLLPLIVSKPMFGTYWLFSGIGFFPSLSSMNIWTCPQNPPKLSENVSNMIEYFNRHLKAANTICCQNSRTNWNVLESDKKYKYLNFLWPNSKFDLLRFWPIF